MIAPIALNGRFLTQGMTGVQRFATEIARAADTLAGEGAWPAGTRVLVPSGFAGPSPFRHLALERTQGGRAGQAWEQATLPAAARGSILVNLGNTAPLLAGRRQAVVIHDAGAFDTPESYSLAFRSWYRVLHHALARLGARILTVSAFSRGRIAHHLRIAPERIGILPEGGEHILRVPPDPSVLARHGLAHEGYALVVGTQAAHKNLAALGEAAALLARRGMVLAVAGGAGTGLFSQGHGAAGARALGRVSDSELRALYESAVCLVFPSRYEGFGLPPVEAMTAGCPVLAAPAGAVPEVCGDAALWFETAPGTDRPLAAALVRLLEEPGLPERLRAAGRARAARFTWRRAAETLLAQLADAPIAQPAPEEALPA